MAFEIWSSSNWKSWLSINQSTL